MLGINASNIYFFFLFSPPVCPKSVALTCPDSIVTGQYAVVTCKSASSNPRSGFAWTIGGTEINPTGSRRYDTDENAGETTTQSHVGTYSKKHNNAQVKCCGSVRTANSPLTCSDDICDTCTLDVLCKYSQGFLQSLQLAMTPREGEFI